MPQPSYLYACARISALEKNLLDATAVKRMAEGSLEDAMRTLLDRRYGGIPDATAADCERMIENERKRTAKEIQEISPDPTLTDLFLLATDIHNLKVLIKARLLGTQAEADWLEGGLYDRDTLVKCVTAKEYRALPARIADRLDALEKRLTVAVEPQRISVALDAAYLDHALAVAKSGKEPFARAYFSALADFDNVLTFLRMRAMGAPREDMRDMLLPEGGIRHDALLAAYELSYESLGSALSGSVARDAIVAGLNDMAKNGSIGALEKRRDDSLLALVKAHKHDVTTIFPVIGFLFAAEREARAIRLILTVKRNGLDDGIITERLREIYG